MNEGELDGAGDTVDAFVDDKVEVLKGDEDGRYVGG
jgi:hypothetical protein